jgi:hypothetical protein
MSGASSGDVIALAYAVPLANGSFEQVWRLSQSTWSPYSSASSQLYNTEAATVTSHNDTWILGFAHARKLDLAGAHWDGNHWSRTELPARGSIHAAAAGAADDVWAGGTLGASSSRGSVLPSEQVMLHYAC